MCLGSASCSRLEKAGGLQGIQERQCTQGIPAGRPQLANLQLVQLVSRHQLSPAATVITPHLIEEALHGLSF